MSEKRWIALTGRSGAGKSEVARILRELHGFSIVKAGLECRAIAIEFFGTDAKWILNRITDCFRGIDQDVWMRRALAQITPDSNSIVFDSLRFREDYDLAKRRGFTIWRVTAPKSLRLARLRARQQDYDPKVDELHAAESSLDHADVDAVVENTTGDVEDLKRQIMRLVSA